MSRFLNGGNRYLGPPQFVGRGKPIRSPVEQSLDPALYEGAVVYATDGQLYYSDKTAWLIPTATVQIGRPAALAPTDSQEQTQLRLTPFYSPQGLTQTGVYFEVANSPDGFDTPLFTRQIATTSGNGYQIVYPGDGLSPGQAVWWRGLYTGTEGSQSDFSLPYRQVYPELIDTPVPVTNDGATSGAVTISAFTSRFGLSHVETEVHFWQIGDDPEVDPPVSTATGIGGASVSLPEDLVEGANYLWRARYGGQAGAGAPVVHSGWTETRTVNNGAASMSLVFDVDLAVNRTISLGLGALSGSVNITVDWGDGTSDAYTSGGVRSHGYGAGVSGQVTVVISGQMAQFGGNHDITGLVRMDAIGYQLGLTSLEQAFRNVTPNTTHVNPALPPQVTSLRGAFRDGNPGFDVGSLDTSAITDMSEMFLDALRFNGDLSGLDTSSVTTMERMFCMDARLDSTAFNQPVGMWDVSKVRNFRRMFAIEGWQGVCVFNQDLGAWDTSAATDMSFMFAGENAAYEHRFDNGGSDGIRSWNVAHVTTFEGMFQLAAPDPTESVLHDFNQPLDGWETASATSMKAMFKGPVHPRARQLGRVERAGLFRDVQPVALQCQPGGLGFLVGDHRREPGLPHAVQRRHDRMATARGCRSPDASGRGLQPRLRADLGHRRRDQHGGPVLGRQRLQPGHHGLGCIHGHDHGRHVPWLHLLQPRHLRVGRLERQHLRRHVLRCQGVRLFARGMAALEDLGQHVPDLGHHPHSRRCVFAHPDRLGQYRIQPGRSLQRSSDGE